MLTGSTSFLAEAKYQLLQPTPPSAIDRTHAFKVTQQKETPMKTVLAGSVLAAGLSVAAMMGASPAQALGLSVDPFGPDNGFTIGKGASADVGDGNKGIAVSIFKPASVTANQSSTGNRLVAVDGSIDVNGASSNRNKIYVVGGDVKLAGNNNRNLVVSGGSDVDTQGNVTGKLSLSVCGTSFSGQAAKVTVSHGAC
jgi:hypothetical protein